MKLFVNEIEQCILTLCPIQAYYRGLFGSNYVFLTIGGYAPEWWTLSKNSSCSPELMSTVISNSFAFIVDGTLLRIDETNMTISGLVSVIKQDFA